MLKKKILSNTDLNVGVKFKIMSNKSKINKEVLKIWLDKFLLLYSELEIEVNYDNLRICHEDLNEFYKINYFENESLYDNIADVISQLYNCIIFRNITKNECLAMLKEKILALIKKIQEIDSI